MPRLRSQEQKSKDYPESLLSNMPDKCVSFSWQIKK